MRNFNNTVFIGKVWQHFDNLPSTNEFLSNSRENAKITEGVVVSTFNQTDGRGQMGNRWLSEPYQNIAVSILLQPSFLHISEQFHLNKAMALAVYDFILGEIRIEDKNNKYDFVPTHAQTTHQVHVKWANDVLINDKKVAGILIQNTVSNNTLQSCIIGIGVNINQLHFDENLNATSLTLATSEDFIGERAGTAAASSPAGLLSCRVASRWTVLRLTETPTSNSALRMASSV